MKDTIAHLVPKASDAWADPDAVRFVAGLPARCREAARGSLRLASAVARELQDVQARQALLLDALPMVVSPRLAQDVAPELPPQAVGHVHLLVQRLLEPKMEARAAQPVPQAESGSLQAARSEPVSPRELPCLRGEQKR